MVTLYGIPNCDTVRKARKWLTDHQIEYQFIDFRKPDFTENAILQWLEKASYDDVLNPRSQAWKRLPEQEQKALLEQKSAQCFLETPTLIKRPVLVTEDKTLFGFDPDAYASTLHPNP